MQISNITDETMSHIYNSEVKIVNKIKSKILTKDYCFVEIDGKVAFQGYLVFIQDKNSEWHLIHGARKASFDNFIDFIKAY